VHVDALGTTATQNYTVGAIGAVFTIIHPATDPYSWHTAAALAITAPPTNITFFDSDPDTITQGVSFLADGFSVDDEIMVVGSQFNDGVYTIADIPAANTLELVASDSLTGEGPLNTVTITNGVLVRVNAPNQTWVEFATTLGVWDGVPGDMVVTSPVNLVTNEAEAVLSSSEAGTANILVSDVDDPSTQDSLAVTFSAPSSEAAKISLQASATIVAPSVGGVTNSVTLTATVKNATDQVVGGAPVAFSIENPTGGGEYVSPPIVYTNDFGVAESTFTSGSLSSDAEGVTVIARVVGAAISGPATFIAFNDTNPDTIFRSDAGSFITDGFVVGDKIQVINSVSNDGTYTINGVVAPTLTLILSDSLTTEAEGERVIIGTIVDSLSIVIGGTAGSVVIGTGTTIESINEGTAYRLPMSVLVSDSNGNPMSGTVVSLSAWPLRYATGCWVEDIVLGWVPGNCPAPTYTLYDNEDDTFPGTDMYRNLILDPGEDVGGDPGHGDGQLTPPNSAAGTLPATVVTDDNGVATFNLIYLKSSAGWIEDEITASTLVYGTETQGTYIFVLPWLSGEGSSLPPSPYNP
jgi:hypothetical protein